MVVVAWWCHATTRKMRGAADAMPRRGAFSATQIATRHASKPVMLGVAVASASRDLPVLAPHDLTRRMFEAVDAAAGGQAGGAGGRTTYDALLAADAAWERMRTAPVRSCEEVVPSLA